MSEETQMELPLERDAIELVQEFITAFDASKDPELWSKLVDEELKEFDEALNELASDPRNDQLAANLLKEICDVGYVVAGQDIMGGDLSFRQLSGLVRVLMVSEDLFPGKVHVAFRRVHASNMSKLGPDGKPIRREDGKVLKGPNYAPPDLMDLVI